MVMASSSIWAVCLTSTPFGGRGRTPSKKFGLFGDLIAKVPGVALRLPILDAGWIYVGIGWGHMEWLETGPVFVKQEWARPWSGGSGGEKGGGRGSEGDVGSGGAGVNRGTLVCLDLRGVGALLRVASRGEGYALESERDEVPVTAERGGNNMPRLALES